jgi:hypothetical protein
MNYYGIALSKGYNGKINLSEALSYFKMSANSGDSIGFLLYSLLDWL